jgi:hypothetical protein
MATGHIIAIDAEVDGCEFHWFELLELLKNTTLRVQCSFIVPEKLLAHHNILISQSLSL